MELYSIEQLSNPHWQYRNKMIADMMRPNSTVLDLGCGAKNLLKFYKPSKYLGVDGVATADLVLDLNTDFHLPSGWDYSINSGILEFVVRPDLYLKKIKGVSNEYFFSWWRGAGWGRMSFQDIEQLISENYTIIETKEIGLVNRLYRCRVIN